MSRLRDSSRGRPRVEVQFGRPDRLYQPHDQLAVRYEIMGLGTEQVRAIEQSIVWYTEGKGEEDLGIHLFERITEAERLPPATASGSFGTRLPASPLTYEGVIVKVRWCVRVRIFFDGGRDFVSEHVFDMGAIPPVRLQQRLPAAGAEP
ncbi:MAG: hypothetical protein ACKOEX_06710 [Planctomycetia bacterium]